ncbi:MULTISPECIES: glutathione S-transferase family protein [unclassified Meridianimarinicoccus]|uniref:glutathione S-transferase family protein n=1 Tax=unclassified Meridianimarinicoccus TaxID=2923344 RepID=UPI00186718B8|nr:glutathione S-transferase family protein [Fluviibacterium sp. MJW13]
MYTVIGLPRTRTFRVIWMLEEAGLDYDLIPAPPQSDRVVAHNDLGKVPILLVEGEALTDSTAILNFLADRHEVLTYPAGSMERARQDGLMHFLLDQFDAALWTAARHSFILPEEHRMPAIKDSLRWEMRSSAKALARRIGDGPYLMGEVLTVPDILAAHCMSWANVAKFDLNLPELNDYLARMQARPAYRAAVARGQAALNSDAG